MSSSEDRLSRAIRLGAGFFADAYALFAIDVVLVILFEVKLLHPDYAIPLSSGKKAFAALAPSLGAVVGMLVFGVIADRVGLRLASIVTSTIIASSSLLSAFCFHTTNESFNVVTQLSILQFCMGLGIGGEYPIAAALSTAAATMKPTSSSRSDVLVAMIFSLQGFGMVTSMGLALFLKVVCGVEMDMLWRLLVGFAAVPSSLAAFLRMRMPPVDTDNQQPHEHDHHQHTLAYYFGVVKQFWKPLLLCSVSWFLLDVTFYGSGQFKHEVYNALYLSDKNIFEILKEDLVKDSAMFGLYVGLMGLPGYFCAAYLFHRGVSKWRVQLAGFLALATCYACFAAALTQLTTSAPVGGLLLFGASFFLSNLGPNTTTFVIPSEVFPHEVRTTTHGISAACGKLGAVVGALLFADNMSLRTTLWISMGVALLGAVVSVFYSGVMSDGGSGGTSSNIDNVYLEMQENVMMEAGMSSDTPSHRQHSPSTPNSSYVSATF